MGVEIIREVCFAISKPFDDRLRNAEQSEWFEDLLAYDNAYCDLTFDGYRAPSIFEIAGAAEVAIEFFSLSKSYSMTGWRVGWMVGPPDVITAATNLQSHATSNVDNVAQAAALAGLTGPMDAAEEMRAAFDRRRKRMIELLCAIPGVSCVEPHGAFYAFPSFEGALDKELGPRRPTSTIELAEVILEEARVAIVPGEAFGAPGYMRLSYALGDDDLEEGLSRIAKLLS